MGLSEHFLVWRLRRGDREACRELIRRHHHGVYGYLRRLGAEAPLAEDLTQETYAKAWRRIGTLRKSSSLRAWLLTIVPCGSPSAGCSPTCRKRSRCTTSRN